jgi:DNA-binding MarR family transcriptional regulator
VDQDEVARLRTAITKLSRRLNASATHEGLTPAQASILGVIVSHGPIGLAELVEIEGVHPTMLSRVVGKLAAEGLIVRGQQPDDLRSATVAATPAGRKKQARVRAERAAVMATYVEALGEPEQRALSAALPALETLASEARSPGH